MEQDQASETLDTESLLKSSAKYDKPWVERNGFPHWVMALFWVVVGLVSFQLVGNIIGLILIIVVKQPDLTAPTPEFLQELVETNLDLFFIGNTSGQILIILSASLLMMRMHALKGKRASFIRWQKGNNTLLITVLGVVLFIVGQPLVTFIGWLNESAFQAIAGGTEFYQFFNDLQTTSADAIGNFLSQPGVMVLALFHVALVPAICEEVMFRGYIMRAFEKNTTVIKAIVFSSLLFGAYHIQLGNLLPLSLLGFFMAYLAWASDSLIPAMVGHFVNNGSAVVLSILVPDFAQSLDVQNYEPSYLLVTASLVFTVAIIYILIKIKHKSTQVDGAI